MSATSSDDGTAFEVTVDGVAHGGEAVGRLPDGKAVFVAGAIPGETVRVRVEGSKKRWARAVVTEVVEASPHRVTPPCAYVPDCGGCDLQHVDPDHQRQLKTRVVREQLQRLGRIAEPPVEPCRAVGPDTRYRASARFHADPAGRLGFHRHGTNEVVPVDQCLILAEDPQRVRDAVGDATGAAQVTVRARASSDAPGLAVLEPGPGPLDIPDGPFDVSIIQQPEGIVMPLRGDGVLTADVAGFTYRFDGSCFFQVNTGGAEAIVEEVLAAAGPVAGLEVWDLYAGVGLLSLPLARAGAIVTAVEAHEAAATWSGRNAAEYGLDVRVVRLFTERFLRSARAGDPVDGQPIDEVDIVVLDPPRKGAGEGAVRDIAALFPATIIYVACDPAALARDAKVLTESGFALERVVPLDLFPMTHHVEAVATFRAR